MSNNNCSEASRLEELWAGRFGEQYLARNDQSFDYRKPFWNKILKWTDPERILEVGCSLGGNLMWLRSSNREVWGLDVNAEALRIAKERYPDIRTVLGAARILPFENDFFDLVISAGVLIHQPEDALSDVMSEMVRCSNRYVLSAEYHADEVTEVEYRGVEGALFKRDYGAIFSDSFPLRLQRTGYLAREATGWDDVTWWLFEKTAELD